MIDVTEDAIRFSKPRTPVSANTKLTIDLAAVVFVEILCHAGICLAKQPALHVILKWSHPLSPFVHLPEESVQLGSGYPLWCQNIAVNEADDELGKTFLQQDPDSRYRVRAHCGAVLAEGPGRRDLCQVGEPERQELALRFLGFTDLSSSTVCQPHVTS